MGDGKRKLEKNEKKYVDHVREKEETTLVR
jgi:hypothetical protein